MRKKIKKNGKRILKILDDEKYKHKKLIYFTTERNRIRNNKINRNRNKVRI